jgi:hypothetical protein
MKARWHRFDEHPALTGAKRLIRQQVKTLTPAQTFKVAAYVTMIAAGERAAGDWLTVAENAAAHPDYFTPRRTAADAPECLR